MASLRVTTPAAGPKFITTQGPEGTAVQVPGPTPSTGEQFSAYMERLVKLVPAEAVSLYLVGTALIKGYFGDVTPDEKSLVLGTQTAVAVVAAVILVLSRAAATKDPKAGKNDPQWSAVAISFVSYLIWVYALGDLSQTLGLFNSLVASLLVLFWTALLPSIYKGDQVTS